MSASGTNVKLNQPPKKKPSKLKGANSKSGTGKVVVRRAKSSELKTSKRPHNTKLRASSSAEDALARGADPEDAIICPLKNSQARHNLLQPTTIKAAAKIVAKLKPKTENKPNNNKKRMQLSSKLASNGVVKCVRFALEPQVCTAKSKNIVSNLKTPPPPIWHGPQANVATTSRNAGGLELQSNNNKVTIKRTNKRKTLSTVPKRMQQKQSKDVRSSHTSLLTTSPNTSNTSIATQFMADQNIKFHDILNGKTAYGNAEQKVLEAKPNKVKLFPVVPPDMSKYYKPQPRKIWNAPQIPPSAATKDDGKKTLLTHKVVKKTGVKSATSKHSRTLRNPKDHKKSKSLKEELSKEKLRIKSQLQKKSKSLPQTPSKTSTSASTVTSNTSMSSRFTTQRKSPLNKKAAAVIKRLSKPKVELFPSVPPDMSKYYKPQPPKIWNGPQKLIKSNKRPSLPSKHSQASNKTAPGTAQTSAETKKIPGKMPVLQKKPRVSKSNVTVKTQKCSSGQQPHEKSQSAPQICAATSSLKDTKKSAPASSKCTLKTIVDSASNHSLELQMSASSTISIKISFDPNAADHNICCEDNNLIIKLSNEQFGSNVQGKCALATPSKQIAKKLQTKKETSAPKKKNLRFSTNVSSDKQPKALKPSSEQSDDLPAACSRQEFENCCSSHDDHQNDAHQRHTKLKRKCKASVAKASAQTLPRKSCLSKQLTKSVVNSFQVDCQTEHHQISMSMSDEENLDVASSVSDLRWYDGTQFSVQGSVESLDYAAAYDMSLNASKCTKSRKNSKDAEAAKCSKSGASANDDRNCPTCFDNCEVIQVSGIKAYGPEARRQIKKQMYDVDVKKLKPNEAQIKLFTGVSIADRMQADKELFSTDDEPMPMMVLAAKGPAMPDDTNKIDKEALKSLCQKCRTPIHKQQQKSPRKAPPKPKQQVPNPRTKSSTKHHSGAKKVQIATGKTMHKTKPGPSIDKSSVKIVMKPENIQIDVKAKKPPQPN